MKLQGSHFLIFVLSMTSHCEEFHPLLDHHFFEVFSSPRSQILSLFGSHFLLVALTWNKTSYQIPTRFLSFFQSAFDSKLLASLPQTGSFYPPQSSPNCTSFATQMFLSQSFRIIFPFEF